MCGLRPRRTYSETAIAGGRTGICGTSATCRASSRLPSDSTSWPCTVSEPVWRTRPDIARSTVVLPAPLGPMIPSHSPAPIRVVSSHTTVWLPSTTETRWRAIAAISAGHPRGAEHDCEEGRPHHRGDHPNRDLRRSEQRACRDVGEYEEGASKRERERQQRPVASARG